MSPQISDLITSPVDDYRSRREFTIPRGQEDAIFRTIAYYCASYESSFITFPANTHHGIRLITPIDQQPRLPLGNIELLPLELTQQIILHLDIASIFRLHQTNTRARQVVSSVYEYRMVIMLAPTAFQALLRTGEAARVTLRAFYALQRPARQSGAPAQLEAMLRSVCRAGRSEAARRVRGQRQKGLWTGQQVQSRWATDVPHSSWTLWHRALAQISCRRHGGHDDGGGHGSVQRGKGGYSRKLT